MVVVGKRILNIYCFCVCVFFFCISRKSIYQMSAFDCSSVTIPIFLTFCVFFPGYDYGYPFIDKDVVDVQENVLDFYLYEFLPDLEKQTMAFIGCIQPTGAIMPIAELQCRYAMQVFKVNEYSPCDTYSTCVW